LGALRFWKPVSIVLAALASEMVAENYGIAAVLVPLTVILAGHTHYWQIANDGRNVAIAMRSIGDPEGGPPGYALAFFHGDDFAVLYRTAEGRGRSSSSPTPETFSCVQAPSTSSARPTRSAQGCGLRET
jgi:hypothetical protein